MSNNVLIFGGSGKCARYVTGLLTKQDFIVHSVVRNAGQAPDIIALGAKPVVKSIEESDVDDMVKLIKDSGANVVIWAAGAGGGNPERTQAVDNEGAIRSMDATSEAGVKRYIIISALDVRDKTKPEPEWYDDSDRERSQKVWGFIGPYMQAKLTADRSLVSENVRRGLEYTIVRPGGLSQDPGKGTVAAGKVHLGSTISREDVASVVVECIKQNGTKGLAFDVVGGETPISEAVEGIVRERIDTFAGRF